MSTVSSGKMVVEAIDFATKMHEGQVRKYTGEPYIEHPIAVADFVVAYMEEEDFTEEEIFTAMTIAVLHDTVEDTDATMEDIVELFNEEVAKGVWFLTKCPDYVGNRRTRKKICEDRLSSAPLIVRLIKTFDMYHNSLTLERDDPKFYKVFMIESESLLERMGTTDIYEGIYWSELLWQKSFSNYFQNKS